ncbi:hypothetical protein VV867_00780 [Pseudomonas sp. JH-2]|nr:hypothetical protein [Pseudomonas sp. JH-2]
MFIWLIVLLSISLYLFCLQLPAFNFKGYDPLYGRDLLKWGWWGITMGRPGWLGNPAFIATIILLVVGKHDWALKAAMATCALGSSSYFTFEWWFNEGGPTPIQSFGPGFYFWELSFATLLGACWLNYRLRQSISPLPSSPT